MSNQSRRRVRRNRPNRFPIYLWNTFLALMFVGAIFIVWKAYPIYIEPLFHPEEAVQIYTGGDGGGTAEAESATTAIPTVPVEDLSEGPSENPIKESATNVQPGVDYLALFDYNAMKSNEYWTGYKPVYQYPFINAVGAEAVTTSEAGTAYEVNIFNWNWEMPGSRMNVAATVRDFISLGFSRDAIRNNMDVVPDGDNINVTVNPPSECATFVGIPISGIPGTPMPGSTPPPGGVNIDLGRTATPSWWGYSWFIYDETGMAEAAINKAAQEGLAAILKSAKLHIKYIESLTRTDVPPAVDALTGTTFPPVRPLIDDIVVSAICWKISEAGGMCDPAKIHITVLEPPKPKVLLWCGSGFVVQNTPYATEP